MFLRPGNSSHRCCTCPVSNPVYFLLKIQIACHYPGLETKKNIKEILHIYTKTWFPYRCICRICRTKKIHRTDITLWKPPVQMLNTKETTDTPCCTLYNEFYLSYDIFSYDRYNDIETRLKDGAYYCYCAYVLRISRYSDFLSLLLTNIGIFFARFKTIRRK